MKKKEEKKEKEALVSCHWGSPSAGEPREELPGRAVEAISRGETRPGVSEGGAGGWVGARSTAGVALWPPTALRGAAPGRRWPPVAAVAGAAAPSSPPGPGSFPASPAARGGAVPEESGGWRRHARASARAAPGSPPPPVFFPPSLSFPSGAGAGGRLL